MKRYIILLLFCTSLSLGASIDEIVRQFPAENLQTRDELCLALLTLGESAIIDICSRLGPAGSDDSAQRFAIAGLCDVASRSDDNAKIVQNALLQAIESKTEPQVQSFLLEQLALIGDATAIRSLEPLLQNDELVDATVRAMITIDPRTAEDYLVRNLDKSDHHQLIAILNALGEIGSAKAVPDLIALAESEHRDVRDGALYALSKSGSAEAGEILGRAMAAAAAMERDKACSYYCDYVEGCAAKKADLYLQLLNAAPPAHVACRAMRGLFEIEGKDCFAVLLEQSEKDAERCGCALRLSAVLAEENISRQWIQFARQTPAREAMIVRALAIRRDESAMAFVAEAMTSLNDDVRLAAVSSYARQQGAAAYDELLRVLQAGRAQEMAEATAQLLSYASSGELLLRLRADLPTLPSISQASVLQMFASRGDVEAKETLYSKANEADSVVRFAALQSLTALVDSTDVTRLLDLLSAAGDEFEFQSLQEALVAAANSARAIDAKPILAAFGEQSGEKKVHLLHVLAQLNSKEALVQVIKTAASTKDDLRASALQALASGPRAKTIPLFLDIAAETGDEQMKELAMEKAQRLAR
ncbi:HEAT repeat domain-containing protein, partial [candidate division KSB1 bacterium]|nr:HEAT repeat domain-containing protein [candidate division KSB1 bacterium]